MTPPQPFNYEHGIFCPSINAIQGDEPGRGGRELAEEMGASVLRGDSRDCPTQ